MSSFIVENKTINRIVNYCYWCGSEEPTLRATIARRLASIGFNFNMDETAPERLGYAMLRLNYQAWNQRYNEPINEKTERKYQLFEDERANIVQALKSLQCFLYQCSEGSVPEQELYKTLREIENDLLHQIVEELPEYQEAEWG